MAPRRGKGPGKDAAIAKFTNWSSAYVGSLKIASRKIRLGGFKYLKCLLQAIASGGQIRLKYSPGA